MILFPSSNAVGRLEPLRDFTRFVAAATTASGAVGVYWGSGGATHEPGFFVAMYVIKFGKALPDGDTVGRADGESLPVHYVDSPIEPGTKVMRVELP